MKKLASEPVPGAPAPDLGARLQEHQPHLTDNTYNRFASVVLGYLSDFPTAPGSEPQAEPIDTEIVDIPYVEKMNEHIAHNTELTQAAITFTEEQIGELNEKVTRELKACWINDSSLHEEANQTITVLAQTVIRKLKILDSRFGLLADTYAKETDIHTADVTDRMTDSLEDLSNAVFESEKPPEQTTTRHKFRKGREQVVKQSWEESKERLLDRNGLRSRKDILGGSFDSVVHSYRRSIYGWRKLVLDQGVDSDSPDEIDEYQKRYWGVFGEQYVKSLSPKEWASKVINEEINAMLYSDDNEFSQRIDEYLADNDKGDSWSRRHRKDTYESIHADDEPHDRQNEEPDDEYTNYTYANVDYRTMDDSPQHLDAVKTGIYLDFQTLVDAEAKSITPNIKQKLQEYFYDMLSDEAYTPAPTVSETNAELRRLVRRMVVDLHPDAGGDDAWLGTYAGVLFEAVKMKDKKHV